MYGPAYAARQTPGAPQSDSAVPPPQPFDGPSPPYTAPYPPYPSDVPDTTPIPVNIAAGLAYLVAPAVIFLLLTPYRSSPLLRFHSWQAIFYFILSVAAREIEQLLASMLPSAAAFTLGGLLVLAIFAGGLVAVIKALQGEKWLLPMVGHYAEQVASTSSSSR